MMKRTLCAAVTAVIMAAGVPAETLTLRGLPALVLDKDPTVNTTQQSALLAYQTYQGTLAQALPQINFVNQYGLDYIPTYQDVVTSYTNPVSHTTSSIIATINNEMNHSLNSYLSLSQILPTAGTLSLRLSNTLTASSMDAPTFNVSLPAGTLPAFQTDAQFSQTPTISLNLDQPLLFNGKIFDMDLFPATVRKAQLGYEEADLSKTVQNNQSVYQAVQLYLQIVQLRKNIAQTQNLIAVAQGNLESLQKNLSLGTATEADILDAKISMSTQNGAF